GVMLGPSWLGLHRGQGQQEWLWLSGAKFNYTRWHDPASLPDDTSTSYCAVMEEDGDWSAVSCDDQDSAYVICDFTPGHNPFVLVGPVVVVCGVIILILGFEVCLRRKEFLEKNLEVITDVEEEPQVGGGIVNYGFGHSEIDRT
ncbi:hypothetical protein OTU49_010448, partial [Cherax quadricarinatus]